MSLALVFNHHSLPFSNQQEANTGIAEFINTFHKCQQFGYDLLWVDENRINHVFDIELSANYFIRDWFLWAKTQSHYVDLTRKLRSIQTHKPLLTPIAFQDTDNRLEVGFDGQNKGSIVLLAAYYYQNFLISFTSDSIWISTWLKVWVLNLDSGQHQSQLANLSDLNSLLEHQKILQLTRNARLADGKSIWENRKQFFTYLVLLDNLGYQLKTWSHRQDILVKARDALTAMNNFVEKWRNGDYFDYRHQYLAECGLAADVSGESNSVHNDCKKKTEREFFLPTGRKVYCENHVKLSDGFRMHFYPDSADKTIYVAYLGPHLTL
ncbi:hypothetical protein [Methylomonas sp. AM2-LC]|uniref:hypothetical protein n=1 Tax=Methylomonas sp. AM2-LC TaxID=3153301 RepID=UPI0032639D2A